MEGGVVLFLWMEARYGHTKVGGFAVAARASCCKGVRGVALCYCSFQIYRGDPRCTCILCSPASPASIVCA